MPSAATFFAEAARAMKRGARMLLVEPAGHVSQDRFGKELALAAEAGLAAVDRPNVASSRAAVLQKS